MITQADLDYRVIHGVVPQLDFINIKDCLTTISAPPVEHTKYASAVNLLKHASAGKMVKGFGRGMLSILEMANGNFGYAAGNVISGISGVASGAMDSTRISIDVEVTKNILEIEKETWSRLYFLRNFVPAQGKLGDEYYKDGSCDEFHCGNGYMILRNGDYFEGLFDDGEIKTGLYIYADGERYLGSFSNRMKNGKGLTIYTDGTYYDGTYQNGYKHGSGTMWYKDGVFTGQWQNGVKHGFGFFKQYDGNCFAGDWDNDHHVE